MTDGRLQKTDKRWQMAVDGIQCSLYNLYMVDRGRVVKAEGDIAEISIVPGNACDSCPACASCGIKEGMRIINARNLINAKPGDIVKISIAEKKGLGAAFILFGLPVILAVIGLIVSIGWTELCRIIFTTSGLIIGLIIAKAFDRAMKNKSKFMPVIIEKES